MLRRQFDFKSRLVDYTSLWRNLIKTNYEPLKMLSNIGVVVKCRAKLVVQKNHIHDLDHVLIHVNRKVQVTRIVENDIMTVQYHHRPQVKADDIVKVAVTVEVVVTLKVIALRVPAQLTTKKQRQRHRRSNVNAKPSYLRTLKEAVPYGKSTQML